jgi:putative acetyltransferase
MAAIAVERATAPTADVKILVDELQAELAVHYPPEQQHGLSLAAIFVPHVRFFVARLDGTPVGCGGVALCDGFAEVKRMYVRSSVRGRGVAEALLARIEDEARAAGASSLKLETGDRQAAAMRFYERLGFRRCGAFGEYAAMPPHAIAASVFYEKPL